MNRLFILAYENDIQRTWYSSYYLPNEEIEDYNVMINGENFLDQPIKTNKVTYENIRKVATGQGDDYTISCLFHYPFFNDSYKMIVIDLSKKHALNNHPRANEQMNLTANLDRAGNTRIYFRPKDVKETILDFLQRTVKVL